MKKIFFLFIFISFFFLFVHIPKTFAGVPGGDCEWVVKNSDGSVGPPFMKNYVDKSADLIVEVKNSPAKDNKPHKIHISLIGDVAAAEWWRYSDPYGNFIVDNMHLPAHYLNNIMTINVDNTTEGYANPTICTYTIDTSEWIEAPSPTPRSKGECNLTIENTNGSTVINNGSEVKVNGNIYNLVGLDVNNTVIYTSTINVRGNNINVYFSLNGSDKSEVPDPPPLEFHKIIGKFLNSTVPYNVTAVIDVIDKAIGGYVARVSCGASFTVCGSGCGFITPTPTPTPLPIPTDNPSVCNQCLSSGFLCGPPESCKNCSFCRALSPAPSTTPLPPLPSLAPLCDRVADPSKPEKKILHDKCIDCVDVQKGIWTAIGCVPIDLGEFITKYVFTIGVGIAGGISFLYFLYGTFLILTSAGVAEKVAEGREIIMSALSGLLLIIFSIFLLRIIGADILRIPGFS